MRNFTTDPKTGQVSIAKTTSNLSEDFVWSFVKTDIVATGDAVTGQYQLNGGKRTKNPNWSLETVSQDAAQAALYNSVVAKNFLINPDEPRKENIGSQATGKQLEDFQTAFAGQKNVITPSVTSWLGELSRRIPVPTDVERKDDNWFESFTSKVGDLFKKADSKSNWGMFAMSTYGIKVFKNIARLFEIERHEHFYDKYHFNKDIKRFLKKQDERLTKMIFDGIKKHEKKDVRMALDLVDPDLMRDKEWEEFSKFSRRLLNNFQYTTPAENRGLTNRGIGIMESQHRKITYRMKNNGMYWGINGAEVMSRMIIENSEKILRELFFGYWREEFEYYTELPDNLYEYLKPVHEDYTPPTGRLRLPSGKNSRY